ncbi:MAG: hypothetical protein M3Y84_01755 [Acidobacteriota bacterium]|nr:hypothetical protein [Acidobacteriota bacterium]
MLRRKYFLGVLLLLCTLTAVTYADQPYMKAARVDLLQARMELNVATHNKSGHRVKALGYVNSALAEVGEGIRFDRRHNQVKRALGEAVNPAAPDQRHMQSALNHLNQAKSNLEAATSDKGSHRVKAIGYVNKAIDEVRKGIEAGE